MPKNARKFISAGASVGREPDHMEMVTPLTPEPQSPGLPGAGGMWPCHVCLVLNRARRRYCRNCLTEKPQLAPYPSTPASTRSSVAEQICMWLHPKGLGSPGKKMRRPTKVNPKSRDQSPPLDPQLNGSSDDMCVVSPIKSAKSNSSGTYHSSEFFSDPAQTVIIFDWDDTLFPTTEFFDEWRLSSMDDGPMASLSEECEMGVQKWQDALLEYLTQACSLSNCVAIVTNSRRPWVDTCINRFCPKLKELFACKSGGPMVVYANELLKQENTMHSRSMDLRPVQHRVWDLNLREEEWDEQLTAAKYAAIKFVVKEFYSQYPNQSWKNIISLGDMMYEHDATQEVTFKHGATGCRTKTIVVPSGPSLSELTLFLGFSQMMLPAYVRFDGDIDLNLQKAKDPFEAIAKALHLEAKDALEAIAKALHLEEPAKVSIS